MAFHVQVREGWTKSAQVYDLTEEQLRDRFLEPRARGESVWVGGRGFDWNSDNFEIEIRRGPPTEEIEDFAPALGTEWFVLIDQTRDAVNDFIKGPPGRAANQLGESSDRAKGADDRRKVMVVHGRDEGARRDLFSFLRALDLRPQEWSSLVRETGEATPYIGQILDRAFEIAQAVVVLFTPDDEARLRASFHGTNEPDHERRLTGQPRQNVLFEAGLALGRQPRRTVLVEVGQLRPISDLEGRHAVRLNGSAEPLRDLAGRLESAGCRVDANGNDWQQPAGFPGLDPTRASAEPSGGMSAAT